MRFGVLLVSLASASLMAGCVTARYRPANLPTLKLVRNTPTGNHWVVGERSYPMSPFGGGLQAAVAGVPEAQMYADDASSDAVTGFSLTIAGPLVMLGGVGVGLLASPDKDHVFEEPASVALMSGIAVGGAIMMLLGLHYAMRSEVNKMDAINAYNDAMWEREHGF